MSFPKKWRESKTLTCRENGSVDQLPICFHLSSGRGTKSSVWLTNMNEINHMLVSNIP